MLIYHNSNTSSKIFNDFENRRKKEKKKYKSIDTRKKYVIRAKPSVKEGVKIQKNKISKKNIKFLDTLGLKVKQNIENH